MTRVAVPSKPNSPNGGRPAQLGIGLLGVVILWTFWPTVAELAHKWFHDAGYSHGILVPFFAGYILWVRRDSARVIPA